MCEFVLTNSVQLCEDEESNKWREKDAEKLLSIMVEHFKEEVRANEGKVYSLNLWRKKNPVEYILYRVEEKEEEGLFEFSVVSMVLNVTYEGDEASTFMELNTDMDNLEIGFSSY